MTKIFPAGRFRAFLIALACCAAFSSLALGEDRFAVVVGTHDKLVVFGPKGQRAAELSVPTVGQSVTVGDVSFQVSYGRSDKGQLMAILSPSESAPAHLHFSVCGKSVDADKAVVTLIFSSTAKSVSVEAGYGGRVEVNSRRISSSEPLP
jgi:hypothetical protein